MAEENNKLNAELRKVEDDLFAADDFSVKDPVPLDNAMKPVEQPDFAKPLPVADEDLSPVEAGFVPVREEITREAPHENPPEIRIMPEIKTFSENRPFHKSDVFNEPVKPVPQPDASTEQPAETVKAVPEEVAMPVPVPEEEKPVSMPVTEEKIPQTIPTRKQETEPAPVHYASVQHQTIAVRDVEHASLGTILREARNAAGLSAEQAADVTKIRLDYIVGIENDDFKRLPPVVFIRAYSRTLASLYKLDQATQDVIMRKVNELEAPADVPEQLLQKLEKDVQVSEEETKKLKRIILYTGLVIALIISLTITCIVAAAVGRSRNRVQTPAEQKTSVPAFQSADLEKLLPQQVPEVNVLEVPQKK